MTPTNLCTLLTTSMVLTLACLTIHSNASADNTPIDVGSEKQLFIDDLFFATSQGIQLQVNPAHKTGELNVQRDQPWESATLNWFSVMEDRAGTLKGENSPRAKYRMWYETYDIEGWPTTDDTSFCYAESTDGIKWTKPDLGLSSYQEKTTNNILFRQIGPEGAHSRVHGASVFKDPNAPKEERYKAVSQGMFASKGTPPYYVAGMYSADGLRWTRYAEPICEVFSDSQYSGFWDDQTKQYTIYGRVAGRGRALGRSTSEDFTFFEPLELVLETDDQDPPNSDLYNPAAHKYPYAANAYFMFPSLFQHDTETLDIHLAVSRDGVTWTWPQKGNAFIPLGKPGEFDSGSLYMGQGILRVGDELFHYYGGSPIKHNESKLENLILPGNSRTFSRVTSRLDGLVSVEAKEENSFFITPPLRFTGNILKLNADVRDGGYLRVALLDEQGEAIPGKTADDCDAITGDSVDALVLWKEDGDLTALAGAPIRLRIELHHASLYAFRFTTGYAGNERDH